MTPTPLVTVWLVSGHRRSPTALAQVLEPAASVKYLLPFIIGAEMLDW
jgi:hypothetical protein